VDPFLLNEFQLLPFDNFPPLLLMFSSKDQLTFVLLYFPFYSALTYSCDSRVEYFEMIPSVKAITARSLGTFSPTLLAVLMMVTAKAHLRQNGIYSFVFQ
jgi:hypothetical protein